MKRPYLNKAGFNKLSQLIKDYINRKIVNLGADAVGTPVGTILPYGGTASPTGWLLCEGQEVLRSDYPELFSVIGTSFGAGDGATTFNLPDMRDRAAMGATTGHILGTVEEDSVKSHTHNFTPKGTVSSHKHALSDTDSSSGASDHTIFTGKSVTSSKMSDHESGTIAFMSGYGSDGTATHLGAFNKNTLDRSSCVSSSGSSYNGISKSSIEHNQNTGMYLGDSLKINVAHTHSVTASGSVTGNTRAVTPIFTGTAGTTSATGSKETKPKNVRVNYIIKAKLVA